MGKINCLICKEMINDRERVIIIRNHLGKTTVLHNLHNRCWEEMLKPHKEA